MEVGQLLPLVLLLVAFYFLLIRPQQRRTRQHQQLIQSITVGDEVVTSGGIIGKVQGVEDRTVDVEIAPGTVVKFAKLAIANKIEPDLPDSDTTTDQESAKE